GDVLQFLDWCGVDAASTVPAVIARYQYQSSFQFPNHSNPFRSALDDYREEHGPNEACARRLVEELYPPVRGDDNADLLRCLGSIGKDSAVAEAFLEHLAWFSLDPTHRRLAAASLRRINPKKVGGLPRE